MLIIVSAHADQGQKGTLGVDTTLLRAMVCVVGGVPAAIPYVGWPRAVGALNHFRWRYITVKY